MSAIYCKGMKVNIRGNHRLAGFSATVERVNSARTYAYVTLPTGARERVSVLNLRESNVYR